MSSSSFNSGDGRTNGSDITGQDEQVGGAQEHGLGRDPRVGETTSTESDSLVRESGAEQEDALRERTGVEATEERGDQDPRLEDDDDRRRREEEFAREHDPANHDVQAGAEFRQRGDIIVEGDRAKVVDGEGRYVDAGDASGLTGGSANTDRNDV